MSDKPKSDTDSIAVSGLFAVPVPLLITAHIRADSEAEALRIARESFHDLSFDLRDGMDIAGIPVNGSERARSLPDVSISPHVVGSDVKHIQFGKNLTEEVIHHGPQDNAQAEMPLLFTKGSEPQPGTVCGVVYCIGNPTTPEDVVPIVSQSNSGCLFFLGTILANVSHDNELTISDDLAHTIRTLRRKSLRHEHLDDREVGETWDQFEQQAAVLRENDIVFSLGARPVINIPVMKFNDDSLSIHAAVTLDKSGQSQVVGVGNNMISAQRAAQNNAESKDYSTVIRAYTGGCREDATILANAREVSVFRKPNPPQPTFNL